MPDKPPSKASQEHKCCGVISEASAEAHARHERRREKGPPPWIVRKLMVGVTLAIIAYSSYVYVARLCVRMIKKERGAQAGRTTGIILLSIFSILLLWVLWAYIKVVLTPPGMAKDYIQKTQQPWLTSDPSASRPPLDDDRLSCDSRLTHPNTERGDADGDQALQKAFANSQYYPPRSQHTHRSTKSHRSHKSHSSYGGERGDVLAGPAYEDHTHPEHYLSNSNSSYLEPTANAARNRSYSSSSTKRSKYRYSIGEMQNAVLAPPPPPTVMVRAPSTTTSASHRGQSQPGGLREGEGEAGVLDALPRPGDFGLGDLTAGIGGANGLGGASTATTPTATASGSPRGKGALPSAVLNADPDTTAKSAGKKTGKEKHGKQEKTTRRASVSRRPSTTPVLLPGHRYCLKDEIVKPYRTHHCSDCGTCILKYDHHCPWIGQCVGARNHKFFLNFCQATAVFTFYILITLLIYTVKANNNAANGGPEDLDAQEIVVIALSALFALFTSALCISHVRLIWQGQSTVESMHIRAVKDRETDLLRKEFGVWSFRAKMRTRKEWDAEWGALNSEGHIWWLGSGSKGWKDVMGNSIWGWFLPIGRSLSDGLDYPVNPRFDEQGRWRRRAEWPEELR
ncbi:DHHC palmitoyltransferase-domain-containing protein [Crucibulum laeve]|uniref:Palmitoyltransferase n=1 Tax=Crucibulum laeve TaxID=68775 RepID=A0A5C3LU25_9AGAR|nr:DHHC palmitoyltransferase-domain-containing protein [Crucibulum laeve]